MFASTSPPPGEDSVTQTASTQTTPEGTAQKRENIRTTIFLIAAIGMIAGLAVAILGKGNTASCPDELIGTWNTAARGYEDSMLVMTKHAVVFTAGNNLLDAQAVRRLDAVPDGQRVLYTLIYGNSRSEEQTLVFFYDPRERTLTFKNQAHLIWTRTMVES